MRLGVLRRIAVVDQAGQRIGHANAVPRELDRQGFRQPLHRMLGRGINRQPRHAVGRRRRRCGEAERILRRFQQRQREIDADKNSDEIYLHDAQRRFIGNVLEKTALADTGVVVENVHRAAGFRAERGDGLAEILFLGDVENSGDAVVAADLLRQRRKTVGIDIERADEPAFLREQCGRRAPDAAGGTGDEDRFASPRLSGHQKFTLREIVPSTSMFMPVV